MLPNKRFCIQSFFAGLLALTGTAQNALADRAQTADPTRPLSLSAFDPATYVIHTNDVLHITVGKTTLAKKPRVFSFVYPDISTYLVHADGTIRVSTLGPVKAEGLTLAQLRTQLAQALSIEE
jgi:protein involved in polysaccharide export with SLBB domain